MMRCLVLLSAVSLVQAQLPGPEYCALDGARAVDDLLDAATYIWASARRCNSDVTESDTILCTLDISASIESVNAMVNVILKAVQKCGHLQSQNAQCGLAVGVLTRSFAGLTAAGSGMAAKCPFGARKPKAPLVFGVPVYDQQTALQSATGVVNADKATPASFGQCLVDIKDLTKSLFKGIKRMMTMQDSCADGNRHCTHNTLKLIASLGAMGEYLSSAIGKCQMDTKAQEALIDHSECVSEVMHLVRHTSNVGRAGVDLQQHCQLGAERLYQLEHGNVQPPSSNSMTFALAAFLPLTAVLSYVLGRRLAKSPAQSFELLQNAEE